MDKQGRPFEEEWSYASVVGMLLYLVNTRPDIQMAVNSCARFSHSPKASHAEGIKRICRYLRKTKDRGLVFRPYQGDLQVDCYVDSDFCGLFGVEDPEDPVSSRSRTGFVIYLGHCPVHWASKLQPLATLSTAEAEYVALAEAMKTLLPVRRIALAVAKGLSLKLNNSRVISKVFEDNQSCIAMARAPALSSRTRTSMRDIISSNSTLDKRQESSCSTCQVSITWRTLLLSRWDQRSSFTTQCD